MPRAAKRSLAWIVIATCAVGWVAALPASLADLCKYCGQERDAEINELKCPTCEKLAEDITRNKSEKVWVLDLAPGKLSKVQIKDDTGDVETFWYLPYTITNRDNLPHSFFLDVSAVSDRGRKKFRYHDTWIPDVYEEIRKHMGLREEDQLLSQRDVSMPPPGERNELPRVSDVRTKHTAKIALPTIQPGETLRCVAIMEAFHPEMDRLEVHVRGLSNSSLIAHDDYTAPDGQPHRRVLKEAVLVLHYSRPGDEFAHGQDPLRYTHRRWIDVERVIESDLR